MIARVAQVADSKIRRNGAPLGRELIGGRRALKLFLFVRQLAMLKRRG
jgi:hypothetical protein